MNFEHERFTTTQMEDGVVVQEVGDGATGYLRFNIWRNPYIKSKSIHVLYFHALKSTDPKISHQVKINRIHVGNFIAKIYYRFEINMQNTTANRWVNDIVEVNETYLFDDEIKLVGFCCMTLLDNMRHWK